MSQLKSQQPGPFMCVRVHEMAEGLTVTWSKPMPAVHALALLPKSPVRAAHNNT